jgi:hypothetical protein
MKTGMVVMFAGVVLMAVLASGVSLRATHERARAAPVAEPAETAMGEGVVGADVLPYSPSVRADVAAYDDLGRAYATARCGHGFGQCPGDAGRALHLSSRDPTVGY